MHDSLVLRIVKASVCGNNINKPYRALTRHSSAGTFNNSKRKSENPINYHKTENKAIGAKH